MDERKGLDPTPDSNPDPITKEPGAHPIGVAGGSAGGAMTGAAIGTAVGGPIGTLVGGAIGAVAGGYAGKGVGEMVNPTEEDAYWRDNYKSRPYHDGSRTYDDYRPAYKYGWESAANPSYSGRKFDEVESDLKNNWSSNRGSTTHEWNDVREATRDAYDRAGVRSTGAGAATAAGVSRMGDAASDAGSYTADKADSVWEQTKGNWKQFSGSVKEKWNDLTDDDIEQMEGRKEKIVGKIQEKYGEAKWKEADIENEFRRFNK